MFEVITATASASPHGAAANADRVRSLATPDGGAGVVLCDGVGSIAGSAQMAEAACGLAADHFEAAGVRQGGDELAGVLATSLPAEVPGATTLIACVADPTGLVGHALVGNGSLFELEPVALEERIRLRWTDIVLPQIDWVEGRPALRSYLSGGGAEVEVARGWRCLADTPSRGYLACTDGIASDEERAQGTAGERVWKEVPTALVRLLEDLASTWPALCEGGREGAAGKLRETLEGTMSGLLDGERLDDDASVGVVFLRRAAAGGDDG